VSAAVTSGPYAISAPAVVTPITMYPTSAYGTPTKRLSPQNTFTPHALTPFATSSPAADAYFNGLTPSGGLSGVHTPMSNSPSIYLQHRASPYKPVRHVNTLLYPPPSASLQDYQLSHISASQMHYQPLGKRDVYRTGIVPEFMPNPYGAGARHHSVTPSAMAMLPSNTTPQLISPGAAGQYTG
jgi:hypothetical protein